MTSGRSTRRRPFRREARRARSTYRAAGARATGTPARSIPSGACTMRSPRHFRVATPGGAITYDAGGKQYIVVPIGGKDYGTGWIALALDAKGTISVPAAAGAPPSPAGSAARAAAKPSGSAAAQGPSSAGELAQVGKFLYQARCARCHGTELDGAMPLRGDEFREHWEGKTARNVYGR